MLSRATHHDQQEILRFLHHGYARVRAGVAEALRILHAHAPLDILFGKMSERDPRMFPEVALGIRFRIASRHNRRSMFGTEGDHRLAGVSNVIAAGDRRCRGDHSEDALGSSALMIVHVMRRFGSDHGHRARIRRKTALDMQRLPRARLLVFGDAVAEFRRRAESGHIAGTRHGSADVHQRQSDRASDRRIALPSRSERVVPGIDVQFPGHRPVDDQQWRAQVGGGLDPVQVECLHAHRFDCEHHQREILRSTSRHHGIRGQPPGRRLAPARRDKPDRLVPWAIAIFEHALNAAQVRRNDRQPVAPSALQKQIVKRLEIVFRRETHAGIAQQMRQLAHRAKLRIRSSNWGSARSARDLISAIAMPPSG